MLSNQMRGRAIRTDKQHPDKVSNIWHLATVLPGARDIVGPLSIVTNDLGPEFSLLERRFQTFVGIHAQQDTIESGLARALYLSQGPYKIASLPAIIEHANFEAFEAARDKDAVRSRWQRILATNGTGQLVHTSRMDRPKLPRSFVYTQTIKAAMLALLANWLAWMQIVPALFGPGSADSSGTELFLFVAIIAAVSLYTLGRFLWYLVLSIKHFSPESSMQQIGESILHSLAASDLIKTPVAQLRVVASTVGGTVACGLKGGTTFENDLFLDCMEELLSPIANPRYLLQSGGKRRFLTAGYSSYSVPAPLARQKKGVLTFLAQWRRRVGPCRGIYTRTLEGRRILLKARRESLSGQLSPRSARHSIWT